MSSFSTLLGPVVSTKTGTVATSTLDGKYVGLYFSAHWCPPCKGFTPKLASFYRNFQATRPGVLEIVFVSSDRSDSDFATYFGEMPWVALPFSDRARKAELSSKFKVSGIPTLILLGPDGEVVTAKARDNVMADPSGAGFPWAPKPFSAILGADGSGSSPFITKELDSVDREDVLSRPHLFFYFSAHWCPPCRDFTPRLAKWYERSKAAGLNVEVVFVSADKSEEEFFEYFQTMPWKAIPFGHPAIDELSSFFEIEGYPTLLLVNPATGKVLLSDGVQRVTGDPEGFPWAPKSCEKLSVALGSINDVKTAVLFLDKITDPGNCEAATDAFKAVAQRRWDAGAATSDSATRFALALDDDESSERVRHFLGMPRDRDGPLSLRVVVLNIPGGKKFVMPATGGVPSDTDIDAFVTAVEAGAVDGVGIRDPVSAM